MSEITTEKTTLDFAFEYLDFGWSVIPVGRDKKPLISWKEFQTRKATKEEVTKWFSAFPEANIGIVTGEISGIVVIDIDPRHGGTNKEFQKLTTVKSKTGGGGWHYFFKYEKGFQNQAGVTQGIDVRGEGGYVVVTPSILESGGKYEWIMSPQAHTPILPFPDEFKKKTSIRTDNSKSIVIKVEESGNNFAKLLKGVGEGERNQTTTKIIGKLFSVFDKKDWQDCVIPILENWNEKNKPPLPESELQSIINSISSRELKNDNKTADIQPISIDDLLIKEFSETKWLVEKLIPSESIVAVSGTPSAYKTWLLLDLMFKVAGGQPLFDKFLTSKNGVLYIDEETGERWIQDRLKKLDHNNHGPIYFQSKTGFKLTNEASNNVIKFSREKGIGLVIFDSLVRISTAQDENNASDIAKVFLQFQKLNKAGLTIVFAHHHRKRNGFVSADVSQDMRGSSDILAGVDCHLAVERKENSIVITQTKLRQEQELKAFELKIITDETSFKFEFTGECNEKLSTKNNFKKAIEEFLSKNNKSVYKTELLNELRKQSVQGKKSSFKEAIDEMIEEEILYTKQGSGNKVFLSLKPFDSQEVLIKE